MNRLSRNPGAWLTLAIFAGLTFLFFRHYPVVAAVLYASVIVYFVLRRVRSSWRLRKLGYRIVWHGRDSFYYEELADGQPRRAVMECELEPRGPRILRLPAPEEWRRKMPEWAGGRREEIVERIRSELKAMGVRYIENESGVA
jgi:hypothetical protein